jgi:hypothetical protein
MKNEIKTEILKVLIAMGMGAFAGLMFYVSLLIG